nr:MAG TPA: hypothetical protein [Caudoviricetes sp.]
MEHPIFVNEIFIILRIFVSQLELQWFFIPLKIWLLHYLTRLQICQM